MLIEHVEQEWPNVGEWLQDFMYAQGAARRDPETGEYDRVERAELDPRPVEEVADWLAALASPDAHQNREHEGLLRFLTAENLDIEGMSKATGVRDQSGKEIEPPHRDAEFFNLLRYHLGNRAWLCMPVPEVDPRFYAEGGAAEGGYPAAGVEPPIAEEEEGEDVDSDDQQLDITPLLTLAGSIMSALDAVKKIFGFRNPATAPAWTASKPPPAPFPSIRFHMWAVVGDLLLPAGIPPFCGIRMARVVKSPDGSGWQVEVLLAFRGNNEDVELTPASTSPCAHYEEALKLLCLLMGFLNGDGLPVDGLPASWIESVKMLHALAEGPAEPDESQRYVVEDAD